VCEYTIATELGGLSVVSPEVDRMWPSGAAVALELAGHGVSIIPG